MSGQRVAIVTGAARGLGRAMAVGLAEAGVDVIAMCRPRASPADDELPVGPHLVRFDGDVTNAQDCERAVAMAEETFGPVNILVNNAALAHDSFPKFHDSDFADVEVGLWQQQVAVNVTGPFLMARAAVPRMRRHGWGRVINISTSKSSMLASGVLPYGPTKAAVEAMTVGWAQHLRMTGVTVNELLPGGPAGPRVPGKHWWPADQPVWPADIMVPPLLWLVSPDSDGVTGCRFIARLWDPELPAREAAARSGRPAGWPLEPEDYGQRPPA